MMLNMSQDIVRLLAGRAWKLPPLLVGLAALLTSRRLVLALLEALIELFVCQYVFVELFFDAADARQLVVHQKVGERIDAPFYFHRVRLDLSWFVCVDRSRGLVVEA